MIPAIAKAQKLARAAKENNWRGSLESEIVNHCRVTVLKGKRNDEAFVAIWRNNQMDSPVYTFMDRSIVLPCAKTLLSHIEGWPDLTELLKKPNGANAEYLISHYRRLPFDPDSDDDDKILETLAGRHIWWYSGLSGKIRDEWVMVPRKRSQAYGLRTVGAHRLFSFTTADTGMRSVTLDSILKVA